MALDPQSIARRDFPTSRRGYDPAAVDAHLQSVADEVTARERTANAAPSLSAQAGTQVQGIIEAAERGAQEIRAAAERESKERLAHTAEAADRLRARIEQLDGEVTALMAGLREGAGRLHEELSATREQAAALTPAPEARAPDTLESAKPETEAPEPPVEAPPATEPRAHPAGPGAAADKARDTDAARIVALDMALSGTPREQTERYLAEHYELGDRDGLLDEVYAAAGA